MIFFSLNIVKTPLYQNNSQYFHRIIANNSYWNDDDFNVQFRQLSSPLVANMLSSVISLIPVSETDLYWAGEGPGAYAGVSLDPDGVDGVGDEVADRRQLVVIHELRLPLGQRKLWVSREVHLQNGYCQIKCAILLFKKKDFLIKEIFVKKHESPRNSETKNKNTDILRISHFFFLFLYMEAK